MNCCTFLIDLRHSAECVSVSCWRDNVSPIGFVGRIAYAQATPDSRIRVDDERGQLGVQWGYSLSLDLYADASDGVNAVKYTTLPGIVSCTTKVARSWEGGYDIACRLVRKP